MPSDKSKTRGLQQQPPRQSNPDQQRSGSTDFQSKPGAASAGQQMGEGSYEATRDYQKNIKEYMEKADLESDARKAKPRSENEAKDLEEAEREARARSKGER